MQILKKQTEQFYRSYLNKNLTGSGTCSHNIHIQTSMKMNARIISQLVDLVVRVEAVQTLDSPSYLQRWTEETVTDYLKSAFSTSKRKKISLLLLFSFQLSLQGCISNPHSKEIDPCY